MKVTRIVALRALLVLSACSKNATPDKPADAATPAKPPLVTVNGKAISASLAPKVANTRAVACTAWIKFLSLTVSSLPRPTSKTRAALTPSSARSSKVEPGLPLMSPDFSAALIAPL